MALSISHTNASGSVNGGAYTAATISAAAGDVVVVFNFMENTNSVGAYPSLTALTVGGNAMTLRNRINFPGSTTFGGGGASFNTIEIWWFYSSGTLTNAALAFTRSANFNDGAAAVILDITGFTGTAYHTNPWDQSVVTGSGYFADNTGATQTQLTASLGASTTNAATMIFAMGMSSDDSATVPFSSAYAVGAIGGTTATDSGEGCLAGGGTNAAYLAVEFRVLAATISGAAASFASAATAGGWGLLVDALSQTGGSSFTWLDMTGEAVQALPSSHWRQDMIAHD